jgi:hypothetical protein
MHLSRLVKDNSDSMEFIAELPTRDAALQLRLRRHRNPNAK